MHILDILSLFLPLVGVVVDNILSIVVVIMILFYFTSLFTVLIGVAVFMGIYLMVLIASFWLGFKFMNI
jgi:hypothetical protein